MMGVADFPIEFLKAVKITPSGQPGHGEHAQTNSDSNKKPASITSSDHQLSSVSLAESVTRTSDLMSESTAAIEIIPHNANVTAEPQSMLEERDSQQCGSLSPTSTSEHRSILGRAIGRSSPRSRSPSGRFKSHSPGPPGKHSQPEHGTTQMSLDSALRTGKGVGRIVGVGLKSPMDFTMSLARGFHNAPKLYGDESVRDTDKVTGIQSGLKAAGKVSVLLYGFRLPADNRRNLDTDCTMV